MSYKETTKKRLTITTLEIAGIASALRALRLPFGKDVRSYVKSNIEKDCAWVSYESHCEISSKDITLLSTLVKRGDEHAKCVRGIIVYAEISCPRWLWSELDTYKIGTERLSSESTMHIEAKGLSGEELMEFKDNIKESHIQKRIQYFSYQSLRRIYFQRRNHRLPVWHEFCDWIKTLPYSDELITVEK